MKKFFVFLLSGVLVLGLGCKGGKEESEVILTEGPDVFYPAVETFLGGEWPGSVEIFGAPMR